MACNHKYAHRTAYIVHVLCNVFDNLIRHLGNQDNETSIVKLPDKKGEEKYSNELIKGLQFLQLVMMQGESELRVLHICGFDRSTPPLIKTTC